MNLSWVEKYRPSTFQEIIEQKDAVLLGKKLIDNKLPMNIIVCGHSGTGKSVWVEALTRELLGPYLNTNLLELNASDELRIKTLRTVIKVFAFRPPMYGDFKITVMEEVDNAPHDTQQALRVIMESSYKYCKFILVCNYPSNIIDAITSRCLIIRFHDLSIDGVYQLIQNIGKKEDFLVTKELAETLRYANEGDMRFVINTLQACDKKDALNSVYETTGILKPVLVKAIFNLISQKRFSKIASTLKNILEKISPNYFIKQLSDYITHSAKISTEKLSLTCKVIADYDERLTIGGDQYFQLLGLISKLCIILGD